MTFESELSGFTTPGLASEPAPGEALQEPPPVGDADSTAMEVDHDGDPISDLDEADLN